MQMLRPRRQFCADLALLLVPTLPVTARADEPGPATSMDRILAAKQLRMAVVANQEPYFKKDLATGEWRGFCVAMGRDIAEQMGVALTLVESTWGNSVLDLETNRIDMAFGLNPTPKRALVIDFPPAIFYNVASLVGRRGFSAKTWDELNRPEVNIAYDLGTSRETIVNRFAPKAQHTAYRTSPECILAVGSGRVDAFACSVFLGLAARKQNTNLGPFIMPAPQVRTVTTAAIQYDRDGRFREFISAWIDFNRGSGQMREWILAALGDMGLAQSDLPPDLEF